VARGRGFCPAGRFPRPPLGSSLPAWNINPGIGVSNIQPRISNLEHKRRKIKPGIKPGILNQQKAPRTMNPGTSNQKYETRNMKPGITTQEYKTRNTKREKYNRECKTRKRKEGR